MKVSEHEHPLKLIDLQIEYPPYEEEEDDDDGGGDPVKKEGFSQVACDKCGQVINMYHKYYYKCMKFDFSLHKLCAELPKRLDHPFHLHPLIQNSWLFDDWTCNICQSEHEGRKMSYHCSKCRFHIDVKCAVEVGKNMIHHPSHPHLLICVTTKPILCHCNACGKRHEGIFYQCSTCNGFTVHSDCAFLSEKLLIQHTTDRAFHHTHPLAISYSFPNEDQEAKHYPTCRVCRNYFHDSGGPWIYKCDKCMYYVHLDCATSRRESFMSILFPTGLVKNYKDAGHPHLVHLPFPDETHNIQKHLFFHESDYEVNLTHMSHQHPLIIVYQKKYEQTSSSTSDYLLLKCYDPMKKTQLLCNGCLRPITSTMPFYKCPHLICNFSLHEWCTLLPRKVEKHPGHTQHTLHLMYSNILPFFFSVCSLVLSVIYFAMDLLIVVSIVDTTLTLLVGLYLKKITHKAHPNHLLSLSQKHGIYKICHMCRYILSWFDSPQSLLFYKCNHCEVYMHPQFALLVSKIISYKYDKHPMHLSYLPIENHKSQYFCEICEEDLNPHQSFYHCQHCVQSIHAVCAPLKLQSETETCSRCYSRIIHQDDYDFHTSRTAALYRSSVYYFVNLKFGSIRNSNVHQHPLSFAQGIASDGQCSVCGKGLHYEMIFKFFECKFAVCHECCKRGNT